ncbi:hypothetical protein CcCBS67573_g08795 [Chytriomyces confervae]|uniref:Reelin domain-containing protein n=1 Tax=Chytriomyces confervae TaxID=246404 RepID=A0A507EH96_9FUNG|nr:hypothetical protein HDU80_008096 [Chytriomyces hyalinus]TPX62797.1 hypothetical protein CcCBS67573_g08795 [Chytriomyces confervae]
MQLIQSISLLTLAATAWAFPQGAPRCKITESIIAAGHKIPQGSLGLVMTLPASYTPGGPAVPITVKSANGKAVNFQGVLAYVTPGNVQDSQLTALPANAGTNAGGVPQHVGTFTNLGAQQLRAQTAAVCTAQNVQNDNAASTITHSQPLTAKTPFTVMWTPPATNAGVVTVNMVISSGASKTPWQIIPSGQIQSTAGAAQAGGAGAGAAKKAAKKAKKAAGGAAKKAAAGAANAAKKAAGAAKKAAGAAKAAAAKAANAAKAAAAKAAKKAKKAN